MPTVSKLTEGTTWQPALQGEAADSYIAFSGGSSEPVSLALNRALGTAAPSRWISPNTFGLALGYFSPLRKDPHYVEPDLVVVTEQGDRWIVEVKMRVQADVQVLATATDLQSSGAWSFIGTLQAFDQPQLEMPPRKRSRVRAKPRARPRADVASARRQPTGFMQLAKEVKEISGLSDGRLAPIFPVSREHFQRWRTGQAENPSDVNVAQMALLHELLCAVRDRVDSVPDWLRIPNADRPSPLDLLVGARFEEAWQRVTEIPDRHEAEMVLADDGGWDQVPASQVTYDHSPDDSPPIPIPADDED